MTVKYVSKSGKVIEFGFDKEVDRTQLFIPELIEDHDLEEIEFDAVKNALKEAFKVNAVRSTVKNVIMVDPSLRGAFLQGETGLGGFSYRVHARCS